MANGVGVVDSDYRGELKVPMINLGTEAYTIQPVSVWHSSALHRCIPLPLLRRPNWGIPSAARAALAQRGSEAYERSDPASQSPRRKELLSLYTTDFTVCVSDFDEDAVTADTPARLVEQLARGKCLLWPRNTPVPWCWAAIPWWM